MNITGKKILNLVGPLLLAALSLLCSFLLLQPIALLLDPTFHLLASRGAGKVTFITMVILQIFLLLIFLPRTFLKKLLKTNIYFFAEKGWFKRFAKYFVLFFCLHWLVVLFLWLCGFAQYNPHWGSFTISLVLKTLFGLFVTFLLAWTEELIFRGTVFPYFCRSLDTFKSLVITSVIFMFAHRLTHPLDWKLGLGLFLLGFLLNLVFIDTGKLYTGMGLHAGLVFVKVILRRAPFLIFLPKQLMPFWVCKDLRQAPLTHVLFLIVIIFFLYKNKEKLFSQKG